MSEIGLEPFADLCSLPGEPPLDLALALIAQHEGSDADVPMMLAEIDALAAGIRITDDAPVIESVARINHRLFHEIGFLGDDEDYDHPRNSRLDHVLATRRGLPILLSALYLEVARRVGFAVHGVGFPGRFLVAPDGAAPAFFVDPFHGGRIWRHDQLAVELAQIIEGPLTEEILDIATQPNDVTQILVRVNRNLKVSWARRSDPWGTLRAIDRLLLLQPERANELRDRGRIRAILGQADGARADLEAYLDRCPEAEDRDQVREELSELSQPSELA